MVSPMSRQEAPSFKAGRFTEKDISTHDTSNRITSPPPLSLEPHSHSKHIFLDSGIQSL